MVWKVSEISIVNINHDHDEMCSRSGMIDTEDIVASVHVALSLAAC